jgi:hypothetical protein
VRRCLKFNRSRAVCKEDFVRKCATFLIFSLSPVCRGRAAAARAFKPPADRCARRFFAKTLAFYKLLCYYS